MNDDDQDHDAAMDDKRNAFATHHDTEVRRNIQKKKKRRKTNTLIVYLHGNASARVEAAPSLSFLLGQVGVFGVVGVDFTGSGKSDGEYVSLGYYERVDLDCLIQHLQRLYGNGGSGDNFGGANAATDNGEGENHLEIEF